MSLPQIFNFSTHGTHVPVCYYYIIILMKHSSVIILNDTEWSLDFVYFYHNASCDKAYIYEVVS